MNPFASVRLGLLIVCLMGAGLEGAGNVALPRCPSVSPDGAQIVFSWRGDLFKAWSGGGLAVRLTSHPGNDLHSAWSRDGQRIAFASDREGALGLYVMNADGTNVSAVTQTDRPVGLVGFAGDLDGSEVLSFSATLEPEPFPSTRAWIIPSGGGEMRRLFEAYGSFPTISPDGSKVLFNRGGASWQRRNYRGSDNRELWLFDRKAATYRRLTRWEGNDGRARWIDNNTFIFASDRQDNCVNLYRLRLDEPESKAVRLTHVKETDVEDFDVSADGRVLVFAMWDGLYRLDLRQSTPEAMRLELRAEEDEQDFAYKSIDRTVSEAALSPDGKTMAFVAWGDVYVRAIESKSPARRVTNSAAREKEIAWAADGSKLYFTSDRSGVEGIYAARVTLTRGQIKKTLEALSKTGAATQPAGPASEASRWPEALAFAIEPVVVSSRPNSHASPSPDGRHLAFRRGNGDLLIMELSSKVTRGLVKGWSTALAWRWSPDSQYIAYQGEDENYNIDIWIIRADGRGEPVNITRHPGSDLAPRWSADGKILSFLSDRVNREFDLWMVYLDKELETLTPAELDQYYKSATAAAKKRQPAAPPKPTTRPATQPTTAPASRPVSEVAGRLDLEDAHLRLRRISTLPGHEGENELTPGGERYVFTATLGTERALFSQEREAAAPKRLGPAVNLQHLSLTGEQVVFVEGGRAGVLKLPAGEIEYFDVSDRIRLDLREQAEAKFLEISRLLGERYWDPKLNGLDWPNLTQRYLALARQTRTADEFDHVANRFLGELNGSHLGVNTPEPVNPNARTIGRLGISQQRVTGGFLVSAVLSEGPAGRGPMRLEIGDLITAIDLEGFGGHQTLESKLIGKVGKETIVTVRRSEADGQTREIHLLLTPISYAAWADLAYKQWRLAMARQVEQLSGGKIGYIHIQGMNQPSLDVFERDLYAAAYGKKGLLIDVRNNGGGWTTDRLLTSIMAPDHAYTIARGMDGPSQRGYPNDRLFIARYTLPINMLCNEKSFSNAEIISHAFKTLKRGTLVGQRTAGAVVSTGGTTLLDGTTVRLPFRGWYLPDGTCQENNGAKPDLLVEQTPEDESKHVDAQLKTAVEDLLKRVN